MQPPDTDGFIEGPSGEIDWLLVGNEENWEYVNDLLSIKI
jgi:hypothetical protein